MRGKSRIQAALDHFPARCPDALVQGSVETAQNEKVRSNPFTVKRLGEFDGAELGAAAKQPAEHVQHAQHAAGHASSPAQVSPRTPGATVGTRACVRKSRTVTAT